MQKRFVVEVRIGEKKAGTGKGRTKKAAEQEAAYQRYHSTRKGISNSCI